MKKKLFYFIALTILGLFNSCKIGRFIYYNTADITDHKVFPNRQIDNDSIKFQFNEIEKQIAFDSISLSKTRKNGNQTVNKVSFEDFLVQNKTVAFLVIKNDTILYENYFFEYDKSSIVNSFSIAKSFTSALIGCAIEDGLINSANQPITDFLPNLEENGFDKITIEHLLDMQSGIKFSEGYLNPFGDVASFYYGTNLRKQVNKLELEIEPGTVTKYRSVDTQLLGMVLEKAIAPKTLSEYLEIKLWKPLGMEYPASWSLDKNKNGIEKTFCCLNARARDFAKFGRLYLNNGNWNGSQVITKDWVKKSISNKDDNGNELDYNNQWWIYENNHFVAEGILGQFISVHPDNNLIFVRLGKSSGKGYDGSVWVNFFKGLESKIARK